MKLFLVLLLLLLLITFAVDVDVDVDDDVAAVDDAVAVAVAVAMMGVLLLSLYCFLDLSRGNSNQRVVMWCDVMSLRTDSLLLRRGWGGWGGAKRWWCYRCRYPIFFDNRIRSRQIKDLYSSFVCLLGELPLLPSSCDCCCCCYCDYCCCCCYNNIDNKPMLLFTKLLLFFDSLCRAVPKCTNAIKTRRKGSRWCGLFDVVVVPVCLEWYGCYCDYCCYRHCTMRWWVESVVFLWVWSASSRYFLLLAIADADVDADAVIMKSK